MARPDVVRAAGACVWRPAPAGTGEVEVLLVHRPRYDDWSLPKGKVDADEHLAVAAVREVEEETGHVVRLGRPLPVQRYVAGGRLKVVHYWAARADDGAAEWAGTAEVDALRWVPTWQAPDVLSHPRDAEIVRALVDGPPSTTPVLVLRHAEALPRKTWTGDDGERPLSVDGGVTAARLVAVLQAWSPVRVVSSDAVRCTTTVGPYAEKAGSTVELEPRVSEAGHDERPEGAAEALEALVADGRSAVLCTHRPVLGTLRAALEGLAWGGAEVPQPQETLRTGGFLVASVARGAVVAVEAHCLDL